jgi:hypothetical protein
MQIHELSKLPKVFELEQEFISETNEEIINFWSEFYDKMEEKNNVNNTLEVENVLNLKRKLKSKVLKVKDVIFKCNVNSDSIVDADMDKEAMRIR